MRKAVPHVSEERVVTPQVRRLLALLLCYEELVLVSKVAAYADIPRNLLVGGLESLKSGDSKMWTLFKDEVDEIHRAFVIDQDKLGMTDIDFVSLWRNAWARSVYGSPQNLIVVQANIRQQVLSISDDGLHQITHAVITAAYAAYCKAWRFDRTVTVVVNGKLLREAISIEDKAQSPG